MSRLSFRSRTTLFLFVGAAAAWAVTVERMRGMDSGPGTDLGGLGWYLGIWVTMTAAMMLPSAAPAAGHVARLARRVNVPTVLFVVGYLATWTAYGLAAYGVFRLVTSLDTSALAWDDLGPYVAGAVIVAAGIYELTPVKRRSLRRCRSARHPESALRSGLAHGLDCVGSSGGLMLVLFVLGVMSLFWMALVAVAIIAEKALPHGSRLAPVVAAALVALGIWVAVSPASVPGLTQPHDGSPSMEMGRECPNPRREEPTVNLPPIVSETEWQAAHDALLVKEKEATRARDALAAERRRLPRVRIEKDYTFDGPDGEVALPELFEGRTQLLLYHFMFGPSEDVGCPGCSMFVDQIGHLSHLHARDTSFALVSRAPIEQIDAYKSRMGWTIPWVSSFRNEFSVDFGVGPETPQADVYQDGETFGLSVFLRDGDGVFRTYFTTQRGVEALGSVWTFLDLTPLGRQEEWENSPEGYPQTKPYTWWRRHDEYADS